MPRSPLTEIVNHVNEMIDYVRENLDEQEYDLFLDLINPEPETKVIEKSKPIRRKKIEHCEVCDYTRRALVHKDESVKDYHEFVSAKAGGKSKRAKGLAAAISDGLQQSQQAKVGESDSDDSGDSDDDDNSNNSRCQFTRSDNRICNLLADHNIHHLKASMDYHEFVEGVGEESAQAASGD